MGWKNAQRKNKISTNKVEKDNAKLKKAVNDVKERKYQINSEFLSFNRYSILENEELIEELTDHGSCETIKITYKALHKKKSKGNRNQGKNTVGSADSNSSEGIYPEVLRCKKCFHSHFPSRKVCKLNIPKEEKVMKIAKGVLDEGTIKLLQSYIGYLENKLTDKTLRLRGGAGNGGSQSQSPLIIARAIESAKKHGIHLVEGIFNAADGNCAFDAVVNNINYRECFSEKLSLTSEVYRQIWVTELENESSKYPTLGAGYTKEEKEENWNRLKQSGVYEIDFFGDMVMHAIARGCNTNILIFNTNVEAADPIYIVEANQFGGFTDTDIPVVVAYNQVHYESLHPLTQEDIEKTKMLVNSYITGDYQYVKKDIPFLISASSGEDSNTTFVRNKDKFDLMFPPLTIKASKFPAKIEKKILTDECLLSMDELKKIKQNDMTEAQKRRYNSLLQLRRESKLTEEK